VQKGLDAKSAIDLISLNSWQPNTVYTLNRYVLDPNGITMKVTTAHTSGASYDATKFTTTVGTIGDATVAGYVNTLGSATSNALSSSLAGATRVNLAVTPHGTSGWYTTAGYNSTYDATTQRRAGFGSRKYTRSGVGQYAPYGRGAGALNISASGSNQTVGLAPVTPGLGYGAGLWLKSDVSTPNAWIGLRFFAADGSTTTLNVSGAKTTLVGGGAWAYFNVYGVAAANSVAVSIEIIVDTGTVVANQAPDGTRTWATDVLLEQRSNAPASTDYFDGYSVNTATAITSWNGTPEYSASTQKVVLAGVKPLLSRTGTPPIGQGEFYVNVADYLASNRVIGVTDDLPAFTAALGTGTFGAVKCYVPQGEYWVSSAVLVPSYAELFGAGMDISIIRLLASAPNDTWVVTNSTPTAGGNVHIRVHDLTLDWRWSATRTGGAGGTRSSCITMRAVQYFWIDRVKSINSGLHAFDVAQGAIDYPYNGDGSAEPSDPSRYGWIRNCIGTAWGDDGITTHHSEYLWIENNFMYDPRERSNCNGIEIDDGSRHVFLSNNMTSGCYGGIELKAHVDANAARDVHINGHYDEGSVRSYNFRHIGHHSGADTVSKSAFDITATNLVSVNPNNDKGFQDDASPRALCISAYHRVSVNGLTAIGRGGYASADVAIAIQYRAGQISLNGINVTGWTGAAQDISITSGDSISISGVNIEASAQRAIYTGNSVSAVQISGVNATAPATGSLYGIDLYDSTGVDLSGINVTGYATAAIRADLNNYASMALFARRAVDVPAAVTKMYNLDPTKDYYASTTAFATFTTDRPAPAATAGGAYFIQHSRLSTDSVIQSLTRNTTSTSQAHYWRVLNYSTKAVGAWNQSTITAVAYSTT